MISSGICSGLWYLWLNCILYVKFNCLLLICNSSWYHFFTCPFCVLSDPGKYFVTFCTLIPGHPTKLLNWIDANYVASGGEPRAVCKYLIIFFDGSSCTLFTAWLGLGHWIVMVSVTTEQPHLKLIPTAMKWHPPSVGDCPFGELDFDAARLVHCSPYLQID